MALAPGASGVVIRGTTAAREPDLAGVVVLDNLLDFEIKDLLGTVIFRGKLQNRVVRSDPTGYLHFYYRIRDTAPGLRGGVVALVTGGFAGLNVWVDYRTDGLGGMPDRGLVAGRSSDGALVRFAGPDPSTRGLRGPEETPFLFIKTDVRGHRTGGETKIEAVVPIPGGAAAPRFATFRTVIATVQPAP